MKSKWELIPGNCLEILDKLFEKKGEFVDLIFCEPTFFQMEESPVKTEKMVKVDKGDWDKSEGPKLNHEFNTEWLKRCQRVLKPNGTIMVSGTFHVIYSIGFAMQELDMKLLNNITWQKPNPPPNLACRYFTHSTETVIWASKNQKSKHIFNYDLMKEINGGKQMKDVWTMTSPNKKKKSMENIQHKNQLNFSIDLLWQQVMKEILSWMPLMEVEQLVLPVSKQIETILALN